MWLLLVVLFSSAFSARESRAYYISDLGAPNATGECVLGFSSLFFFFFFFSSVLFFFFPVLSSRSQGLRILCVLWMRFLFCSR